jgi:hypothetical protein
MPDGAGRAYEITAGQDSVRDLRDSAVLVEGVIGVGLEKEAALDLVIAIMCRALDGRRPTSRRGPAGSSRHTRRPSLSLGS